MPYKFHQSFEYLIIIEIINFDQQNSILTKFGRLIFQALQIRTVNWLWTPHLLLYKSWSFPLSKYPNLTKILIGDYSNSRKLKAVPNSEIQKFSARTIAGKQKTCLRALKLARCWSVLLPVISQVITYKLRWWLFIAPNLWSSLMAPNFIQFFKNILIEQTIRWT